MYNYNIPLTLLPFSVALVLAGASLADARFQVMGIPPHYHTAVLLCFVISIIFLALCQTLFYQPGQNAATNGKCVATDQYILVTGVV